MKPPKQTRSSGPLLRSLILHGTVIGVAVGYGLLPMSQREAWGDPNALPGGGVAITPVSKIPMMVRPTRPNPVAAETESEVKQNEPKPEKTQRREDPDAIPLKTEREKRRVADVAAEQNRYRPHEPKRPNELTTTVGRTLTNPMFGVPGAGGVEVGWRLGRKFWGQGYASEAARAALGFAFGELALSEVHSITAVINLPSRAVMERLGMTFVDEFEHPRVALSSPLRPHVRYRIMPAAGV